MLNPAAGTRLIALAVLRPALGLVMWLVIRARRPRNHIWQRRALQASQRRQLRDQIKAAVEADPALAASRPQPAPTVVEPLPIFDKTVVSWPSRPQAASAQDALESFARSIRRPYGAETNPAASQAELEREWVELRERHPFGFWQCDPPDDIGVGLCLAWRLGERAQALGMLNHLADSTTWHGVIGDPQVWQMTAKRLRQLEWMERAGRQRWWARGDLYLMRGDVEAWLERPDAALGLYTLARWCYWRAREAGLMAMAHRRRLETLRLASPGAVQRWRQARWRVPPVPGMGPRNNRVARLRAEQGLRQEDLAALADLPVITVRRVEHGQRLVGDHAQVAHDLDRLAAALGREPDRLYPPDYLQRVQAFALAQSYGRRNPPKWRESRTQGVQRLLDLRASDLDRYRLVRLDERALARPEPLEAVCAPRLQMVDLRRALGNLNDTERSVLTLLFGLSEAGEHSAVEIALVLGLSTPRVQQVVHKALRKLRRPINAGEAPPPRGYALE